MFILFLFAGRTSTLLLFLAVGQNLCRNTHDFPSRVLISTSVLTFQFITYAWSLSNDKFEYVLMNTHVEDLFSSTYFLLLRGIKNKTTQVKKPINNVEHCSSIIREDEQIRGRL